MSPGWTEVVLAELASEALLDEGAEAARNACVAGASLAAALITAAAYWDNPLTGAPALRECMRRLASAPLGERAWLDAISEDDGGEPFAGAAPGFGYVTPARAEAIVDACRRLTGRGIGGPRCDFFLQNQAFFAGELGALNVAGLCALLLSDRGLDARAAERQFLLWQLDIALREGERARRAGVMAFPFASERYVYEGPRPERRALDLATLTQELGLDVDV